MNSDAENWSEDWPDEADNEELARFAAELAATLPSLPSASLRRIEQTLWSELAARSRRRRQAVIRYSGVAAAVLLGLIGSAVLLTPGPPGRRVERPVVRAKPPVVEDRYEVRAPVGVPVDARRPLVVIEEYRSLFAGNDVRRELPGARREVTVPEGRLTIAQDFSPGDIGVNKVRVPEGRLSANGSPQRPLRQ